MNPDSKPKSRAWIIWAIAFVAIIIIVIIVGIRASSKNDDMQPADTATQTTQSDQPAAAQADTSSTSTNPTTPSMDASTKNLQEGQAYLAKNKTAPGVTTTASGLQYKVLREGTGAKPKSTDTVEVNYEGRLIDGTIFDSSYKRGESISFPLNGVIAGWTEGLQLMPVGSKFEFTIPANLAYGPNGAGGSIGPNETLIFDVELISIK